MNKHLILCGLAATMFMASCSNEGDITATSTTPTDNGEQIKVTLNQNSTITRASLGNKTDGAYDGTFDTDQLGIYCLATGKIYASENITWNDPNDNPNMLWMQNIRAKAVTTATATASVQGRHREGATVALAPADDCVPVAVTTAPTLLS